MAEVEIVLTATDDTGPGVRSAQRNMGRLSQSAGRSFGGLNKLVGVGMLGAVGAAAGGVALLGAGLQNAISVGSDAQEMMGKFNTVFGEFAQESIVDLDNLAMAVGRNKFDLRGFASTFQDTFVPLGFARDEAANLSEQLTGLTVDLASFNNIAEPDVLRALQSALVGNHETMRQFGVIITQTTLEQELLRMGIEDGIKAATEQQKVQARLNLIMAGTADAQGDAARTADSWANQMRTLKSRVNEAFAEIGLKLLPVLTPLLEKLGDLAEAAVPHVIRAVEMLVSWFGTVQRQMEGDLPGAIGELKRFWDDVLLPALRRVWTFTNAHLVPIFRSLVEVWFAGLQIKIGLLRVAFETVLLPALTAVWNFLNSTIIPAFQRFDAVVGGVANRVSQLANFLSGIGNSINAFADRLGGPNVGFPSITAQSNGAAFAAPLPGVTVHQVFQAGPDDLFGVEEAARNGVTDALLAGGR